MNIISIVLLLLLTGCGAINKHLPDLKSFFHDVVDEEIGEFENPIEITDLAK